MKCTKSSEDGVRKVAPTVLSWLVGNVPRFAKQLHVEGSEAARIFIEILEQPLSNVAFVDACRAISWTARTKPTCDMINTIVTSAVVLDRLFSTISHGDDECKVSALFCLSELANVNSPFAQRAGTAVWP